MATCLTSPLDHIPSSRTSEQCCSLARFPFERRLPNSLRSLLGCSTRSFNRIYTRILSRSPCSFTSLFTSISRRPSLSQLVVCRPLSVLRCARKTTSVSQRLISLQPLAYLSHWTSPLLSAITATDELSSESFHRSRLLSRLFLPVKRLGHILMIVSYVAHPYPLSHLSPLLCDFCFRCRVCEIDDLSFCNSCSFLLDLVCTFSFLSVSKSGISREEVANF